MNKARIVIKFSLFFSILLFLLNVYKIVSIYLAIGNDAKLDTLFSNSYQTITIIMLIISLVIAIINMIGIFVLDNDAKSVDNRIVFIAIVNFLASATLFILYCFNVISIGISLTEGLRAIDLFSGNYVVKRWLMLFVSIYLSVSEVYLLRKIKKTCNASS